MRTGDAGMFGTSTEYETVLMGACSDKVTAAVAPAASIYGGGGNDTLVGSDGADVLSGGRGYDVLFGVAKHDSLIARRIGVTRFGIYAHRSKAGIVTEVETHFPADRQTRSAAVQRWFRKQHSGGKAR